MGCTLVLSAVLIGCGPDGSAEDYAENVEFLCRRPFQCAGWEPNGHMLWTCTERYEGYHDSAVERDCADVLRSLVACLVEVSCEEYAEWRMTFEESSVCEADADLLIQECPGVWLGTAPGE